MGKLIILSAPSGSGKTTICDILLEEMPELEFSISATSREPRGQEKDKVNYYFLSVEDFREKIGSNDFVEWEEVYDNQFYGTLKSELDRIWEKGNHVVFDVDVLGGINLKKKFGDQALSLFIQPPSVKELKKRLIMRSTETADSIIKRLERAEYEISFADQFDKAIINDKLDVAVEETIATVKAFLEA